MAKSGHRGGRRTAGELLVSSVGESRKLQPGLPLTRATEHNRGARCLPKCVANGPIGSEPERLAYDSPGQRPGFEGKEGG